MYTITQEFNRINNSIFYQKIVIAVMLHLTNKISTLTVDQINIKKRNKLKFLPWLDEEEINDDEKEAAKIIKTSA